MTRTTHRELDDWLREGRIEPMPDALATHVTSCGDCRDAIDALDEVRAWFPDETPEISRDAAAAIRFRLQAEARSHAQPASAATKTASASGSSRGWLFGIAAAAAVLLALGGAFAVGAFRGEDTMVATGRSVPRATVSASRGSILREVDAETYRMSEGSAWFDVPPRAPGRRFRVLVGAERVEVHGTRFRVRAHANVLDSVEVAHGVVSVHLTSGVVHTLVAGQRYDRVSNVAASAVAPRATADASVAGTVAPSASPSGAAIARPPSAVNAAASPSVGATAAAASADVAAVDRAFRDAWQLRSAGRYDDAARAFDALLARGRLGARRADVLYWSARAHESAGRRQLAAERLEKLVRTYPRAWHAAEARRRLEAMGAQ